MSTTLRVTLTACICYFAGVFAILIWPWSLAFSAVAGFGLLALWRGVP